MILLYVIIGGMIGFIVHGGLGLLIGILIGVVFSIGQSLEKKISELQLQIQQVEFKMNDETVERKRELIRLTKKVDELDSGR